MYTLILRTMLCAAIASTGLISATVHAQSNGDSEADNGTDPSKVSSSATVQWERQNLRSGGSVDTLKGLYVVPLGSSKTKLTLGLPLVRNDALGHGGYDLGDATLGISHVYALTKAYAVVLLGELAFNTAQRPELGSGKTVFKATYINARFLEGGNIFAPAIVHNISIGGDSARATVNRTVLDFYYVPKLADRTLLMTLDPALSFDWENKKQFASLAVTFGRIMGPAFGGNSQVFIKPSVNAGSDRPGDWGIQLGYKVIGF
jgi:hypothetical protein